MKKNATSRKENSRIIQVIFVRFPCILGETGLRKASFELAKPSRVMGLEYFLLGIDK